MSTQAYASEEDTNIIHSLVSNWQSKQLSEHLYVEGNNDPKALSEKKEIVK